MSLLGGILTLLLCSVVAVAPRRFAALAFLAGPLFITQGQAINVAGFSLWGLRFVEIVAFFRIVSRGEFRELRFTIVDKLLIVFLGLMWAVTTVRSGAVDVFLLGNTLDAWLVYFAFRALIVDQNAVLHLLKGAVYLLVPFTILMVIESSSGFNWYSVMGGVPQTPLLREGHYRCQGSFNIAITAGSLGATFFPMFFGLMFQRPFRHIASIGILECIAIVMTSRSSGPLMAIVMAVSAWVCWCIRYRIKLVRFCVVAMLIGLHMSMKQPVWFMFDRLSGFLGGDGWHRANLIDQFVKHFWEWWLLGMNIQDTGDWAATKMPWGGIDVTNYYVAIGLAGGLVTLVLFILLLAKVFHMVGAALASIRTVQHADRSSEAMLWGVGAAMATHAFNIMAVMYWDQFYVIWYLHLALCVSLCDYWISGNRILIVRASDEVTFPGQVGQNA